MDTPPGFASRIASRIFDLLPMIRDYFGIGGKVERAPVTTPEELRAFVASRASFIAQTSLYGYLRTRAGQRYPEMFDNDEFVVSINRAKWHIWLACLSDLSMFSGGLLVRGGVPVEQVGALQRRLLDESLDEVGVPSEASPEFAEHAQQVRARIALVDWRRVPDNEDGFIESPEALVKYAPIVESIKQLDADIVRSSVRYHWIEVRKELRELLDVAAVAGKLA